VINEVLRYIGVFLRYVTLKDFRVFLLLETLARTLKNALRSKLRETQKCVRVIVSVPYRQAIIDFFNLVFGHPKHMNSAQWWHSVVTELQRKFHVDSFLPGPLELEREKSQSERGEGKRRERGRSDGEERGGGGGGGGGERRDEEKLHFSNLLKLFDEEMWCGGNDVIPGRLFLFQRLSSLMSLTFLPTTHQKIRSKSYLKSFRPFELWDLVDLQMRIKHTNMVSRMEGNFYHWKSLEALRNQRLLESVQFLDMAIQKYEFCLLSDPTNPQVFFPYLIIEGKYVASFGIVMTECLL
jgi:hypothetical protein